MHTSRPHAELVADTADMVWRQLRAARGPMYINSRLSCATIAVAVEAFGNILLAEEADALDSTCKWLATARSATPFVKLIDARITQSALTGVTVTIFEEELGADLGGAHGVLSLACTRCYFDRYMGYTAEGCAWSIEIVRTGRPATARWPASRVQLLLGHHP